MSYHVARMHRQLYHHNESTTMLTRQLVVVFYFFSICCSQLAYSLPDAVAFAQGSDVFPKWCRKDEFNNSLIDPAVVACWMIYDANNGLGDMSQCKNKLQNMQQSNDYLRLCPIDSFYPCSDNHELYMSCDSTKREYTYNYTVESCCCRTGDYCQDEIRQVCYYTNYFEQQQYKLGDANFTESHNKAVMSSLNKCKVPLWSPKTTSPTTATLPLTTTATLPTTLSSLLPTTTSAAMTTTPVPAKMRFCDDIERLDNTGIDSMVLLCWNSSTNGSNEACRDENECPNTSRPCSTSFIDSDKCLLSSTPKCCCRDIDNCNQEVSLNCFREWEKNTFDQSTVTSLTDDDEEASAIIDKCKITTITTTTLATTAPPTTTSTTTSTTTPTTTTASTASTTITTTTPTTDTITTTQMKDRVCPEYRLHQNDSNSMSWVWNNMDARCNATDGFCKGEIKDVGAHALIGSYGCNRSTDSCTEAAAGSIGWYCIGTVTSLSCCCRDECLPGVDLYCLFLCYSTTLTSYTPISAEMNLSCKFQDDGADTQLPCNIVSPTMSTTLHFTASRTSVDDTTAATPSTTTTTTTSAIYRSTAMTTTPTATVGPVSTAVDSSLSSTTSTTTSTTTSSNSSKKVQQEGAGTAGPPPLYTIVLMISIPILLAIIAIIGLAIFVYGKGKKRSAKKATKKTPGRSKFTPSVDHSMASSANFRRF